MVGSWVPAYGHVKKSNQVTGRLGALGYKTYPVSGEKRRTRLGTELSHMAVI